MKTIEDILSQENLTLKEIILFGSRARGDFDPKSDYDILIIIKKTIPISEKIRISEIMNSYLVEHLIPSDIIIKSIDEVEYYKNKIGHVVREALKEGVVIR